jgi:hypothetical protein
LTADLATSGEADGTLVNGACSVTLATPPQLVAWRMLTFPVDTVYIINVKINYGTTVSVFSYQYTSINLTFLFDLPVVISYITLQCIQQFAKNKFDKNIR